MFKSVDYYYEFHRHSESKGSGQISTQERAIQRTHAVAKVLQLLTIS